MGSQTLTSEDVFVWRTTAVPVPVLVSSHLFSLVVYVVHPINQQRAPQIIKSIKNIFFFSHIENKMFKKKI